MILLIFLTLVLVGGAALIFFGFADNLADEKQVYLTTEATGNSTHPLAIQIWKIDEEPKLKEIFVSVSTPNGVSTGTPDLEQEQEIFFEGESIPIEFDTGFPKGSYPVTVTGVFDDGTEQVLLIKTMTLEAEGQTIQEVSTEKLLLTAAYAYWAPNKIYLTDVTPYKNITNISYWTLDLGYSGVDTKRLSEPANDLNYTYPPEAFSGSSQIFVITYTAYYTDGKSKTSVQKEVQLYASKQEDELGDYIGNYKIGGESLQGTGNKKHHIYLIGTTSTEIWREDIAGRTIKVDGQNLPALQINLNSPKNGANSVTITCDTDFNVASTYFASGETYKGNVSTICYLNTARTSSITITLKVYDINETKLAEQTTEIIIRE